MANISQMETLSRNVWAKRGKRRRERKGDIKENAKKKSLHVGIPFFWRKFDADVSAFGRRYDTFIDPVASNVYESLFEREDESIDARQVHAWLKHASLFLLSLRAFDAHYQDSPFIQKPEMLGALLNPTARYAEVVPRLYVYIFPSAVPASIVRRLSLKK